MSLENTKCVMILNEELLLGVSFIYWGIGIYGTKKLVNKLTGILLLLR